MGKPSLCEEKATKTEASSHGTFEYFVMYNGCRTFEQLLLHPSAQVTVSYLQIYCEVISDLLDPSRQHLSIREHNGNIFVEGLSSVLITSAADVASFLAQGDRNRTTASTHMNETSSRSHAAVLINISKHDDTKQMKQSTLVLVDLAGSEK